MLNQKQRRAPIGRRPDQEEYTRITFQQGLDFAINAKRSEGLRERTLTPLLMDMDLSTIK
ncbi:hypothetical protein [Paenibacillus agri]|uniref:Uncharacterized protein n=1 Tax=Paenibacillus agri TaxID=2744309 RepID=A0A850EKC1_9BACL|nr:hypothetical protein [Paenibacillus agri]NUU60816.1 hypothetical protein [Paenibacillus agri]